MDRCSSLLCRTDLLQFTHDFTAFITLIIFITIYINIDFKPFGQGINNRCTDTMKSAGYLISAAAEFTAGMQHGIRDRRSGNSLLRMDANRNAASVVPDFYHIARQKLHINDGTVTSQRLVDGVVHNFINKMVKSSRTC